MGPQMVPITEPVLAILECFWRLHLTVETSAVPRVIAVIDDGVPLGVVFGHDVGWRRHRHFHVVISVRQSDYRQVHPSTKYQVLWITGLDFKMASVGNQPSVLTLSCFNTSSHMAKTPFPGTCTV